VEDISTATQGSTSLVERRRHLAYHVRAILRILGQDVTTEGLKGTPDRVARMYEELLSGYDMNLDEVLSTDFAAERYDEMVMLKNIEFYSLCEHHMLPFFGTCTVAYIPKERVVGVSKLARLVEMYSRRLQIQERMTVQIADALFERLQPLGVMVVAKAKHLCMVSRGIKKQQSDMVTSAIRGVFEDHAVRQEFFDLQEL